MAASESRKLQEVTSVLGSGSLMAIADRRG